MLTNRLAMLNTLLAVMRKSSLTSLLSDTSVPRTHPMEPVMALALTQERIMASFSLPCSKRQQKIMGAVSMNNMLVCMLTFVTLATIYPPFKIHTHPLAPAHAYTCSLQGVEVGLNVWFVGVCVSECGVCECVIVSVVV